MEFIESMKAHCFTLLYRLILLSFSGVATVCMDLGHLTLKRGTNSSASGEQSVLSKEAKVRIVNLSSSARHFIH